MIPILSQDINIDTDKQMYLDILKQNYDNILNPHNNTMTKLFLNEGYNLDEAYSLSFMAIIMLYQQINTFKQ